ncbi:MAG TPA: hypothetical protein VHR84_18605 [Terriglobales bacterium]|jgi:hypothetical protein|nr:hypothetical protein [Terriglobales bacterium]
MQAVTRDEIEDVLSRYEGLVCTNNTLDFSDPEAQSLTLHLKDLSSQQLLRLARFSAHLYNDERHFAGASLWITQWGVWNEQEESIPRKAIERMRQGFGENRSLETAPGHFFRSDEFVESIAFLLQPMLAGWDAFFIPQWPKDTLEYFLFVSHDSVLEIRTRTAKAREQVDGVLGSFGWDETGAWRLPAA